MSSDNWVLFVHPKEGSDESEGTREKPLKTFAETKRRVWDKPIENHGGVVAEVFEKEFPFSSKKLPSSWFKFSTAKPVRTTEEALQVLKEGKKLDGWVQVTWGSTIAENCQTFHSEYLPRLKAFTEKFGITPDDVRLVFGFDS